jgi:hypothetical protein
MRPSNGLRSARTSRAGFGAFAETGVSFIGAKGFRQKKSPRWRGAIGPSRTGDYTRGRVSSPEITKANEYGIERDR